MQGTPVASYLRQWGVVAGSGAWREGIDKMEIILIFNLAVKSAFHRNPKIFTGKNFQKKKNRFSFISMSKMAVTKTKNFMKKVRGILSVFILIISIFAATGSSTRVAAQPQLAPPDCVDVFSVRCHWTWGDCCYVSSQAFSCVQRIC